MPCSLPLSLSQFIFGFPYHLFPPYWKINRFEVIRSLCKNKTCTYTFIRFPPPPLPSSPTPQFLFLVFPSFYTCSLCSPIPFEFGLVFNVCLLHFRLYRFELLSVGSVQGPEKWKIAKLKCQIWLSGSPEKEEPENISDGREGFIPGEGIHAKQLFRLFDVFAHG